MKKFQYWIEIDEISIENIEKISILKRKLTKFREGILKKSQFWKEIDAICKGNIKKFSILIKQDWWVFLSFYQEITKENKILGGTDKTRQECRYL